MAKMKGHKNGCRCVGCSAATRQRGQAALQASRDGGSRSNPAGPRKTSSTTRPRTRKNPAPSVVVVQAPPAPTARKNPAAPAKKAPPSRPHPHLPSGVVAGGYLVLCTEPGDGGRLRPVKAFTRISDANLFARELPAGSKAFVVEVRSTWG